MAIDLSADIVFARIAGEQFDEYAHVEVLYYPIGAIGGVQMPQLTIGNWLEALWRLKTFANQLNTGDQQVVDEAQAGVQRVRSRAGDLYKQKARREFKSRLDTWTWYLDELLAREPASVPPEGQAYATQVHVRFKLELLVVDVPQMTDQMTRLATYDKRLRTRFISGPFMWAPDLAPALTESQYWWLYGRPS